MCRYTPVCLTGAFGAPNTRVLTLFWTVSYSRAAMFLQRGNGSDHWTAAMGRIHTSASALTFPPPVTDTRSSHCRHYNARPEARVCVYAGKAQGCPSGETPECCGAFLGEGTNQIAGFGRWHRLLVLWLVFMLPFMFLAVLCLARGFSAGSPPVSGFYSNSPGIGCLCSCAGK